MSKINIQRKLLIWFKKNKRSLPWRHEHHWYFIWVSEIMLQQTQVEQAIPYYLKFIKRFGTVKRLAEASEQEVLKTWSAIKHSYTHFHLTLYSNLFITESFDFKSKFYKEYQWMDLEMIKKLPLHKAMWKLLQQIDPELEIISE